MADKRIFIVANSHIDPVWLWDKYEGIDEVINTFRSACDRLEEYPDIKFSASSTCFYKWVEQYAPEVFKRIKMHIKAGRWEIVGGWWVESDCNLPLSESFYKSAELSQTYISMRFGVKTPVAYCPDSFGHAASLPGILADSGFKYFIFCRPDESEKGNLPGNLFYWEHGGKRVLCYRLKYFYTQDFLLDTKRFEEALTDRDFIKDGVACYFFGVGDHGGGPTKSEIEYFIKRKSEIKNCDITFSTCVEFFREAEKIKDIPVYSGDLHYHAVGCYSVNRALKQAIRDAEYALLYTRRVMDVAGERETVNLNPLWEKTIFNQFHDMMAGSCSSEATRQAMAELGGVHDACLQVSYNALKSISSTIPVECSQGEFRIFNSLPDPLTGPFEIESFLYFRPGAPFKDSSGNKIQIQETTPSVTCVNRRWLFVDTIPAKTMKSYYFDSDQSPSPLQTKNHFYTAGNEVSGGDFKIDGPGKITDVRSGNTFFKSPLILGVIEDDSDTWSHGVRGYGRFEGYFEEISSVICKGSLVSFLISRQRYGCSLAELRFAVYEGLPYVDLFIKVRWGEERSILKLEIEPTCRFSSLLVQSPGSAIEKIDDGLEEPLHGWILSGEIGILQDGAFAFDRQGKKLRVTLVRSSLYGYYCSKDWTLDHLGPLEHTDLSEHRFKFRFIHQHGLNSTIMNDLFAAFREPFSVIRENSRY